jgi:hypothetical protein
MAESQHAPYLKESTVFKKIFIGRSGFGFVPTSPRSYGSTGTNDEHCREDGKPFAGALRFVCRLALSIVKQRRRERALYYANLRLHFGGTNPSTKGP